MKLVEKDETWAYVVTSNESMADGRVPDELAEKLRDAYQHYLNVNQLVANYLNEHPENRID